VAGGRGRHVTLVVPGLLGSAGPGNALSTQAAPMWSEGLALPALERFFSRAVPMDSRPSQRDLATLLFESFGVEKDGSDWPAAAVTRCLDGAGDDGRWWLRADPVHLRANMGDLSLVEGLQVSMAEARALAAEINDQLGDPGVCLQVLAPNRWYLGFDAAPDLVTQAPWETAGSGVGAHLPRGVDASQWQTRINHVQMILHASPVNSARESRGEPIINSLWLWGGGRSPRVPAGLWHGVWSDDELLAGLAQLAKIPRETLPADARAWLTLAGFNGDYLIASSAAYVPVRCRDVDAWRAIVLEFEASWMMPLLEALKAGRVQSVSLRGVGPRDFRLNRRQLRHWWRRTKPFARILSEYG